MFRKFAAVLMALITLCACAKRPDAIAPISVSESGYMTMDCQLLSKELTLERQKLAALTKQQNDAATGDAVGVFLFGVPTASVFGGDKEGKLAVSKGTVMAMENAQRAKNCGAVVSQASVVQAPVPAAQVAESSRQVTATPVPSRSPAKIN